MKAIQYFTLIIFTSVLMGCQIEVTPLDVGNAATADHSTSGSKDSSGEPTDPSNPIEPTTSLTITWEIPVERENNEQLFVYEIGGYEIEYRKVGETTYNSIIVEDGTIDSFSLTNLNNGEYEVRVAAFDTNGLYSQFSDSAILTSL